MESPEAVARFIEAVHQVDADTAAKEVTSIRRSPAVSAALALAVDAGICESASEFQSDTLLTSLRLAAHRAALDLHYTIYPEDRPSTIDVAQVRAQRAGLDDLTRDRLERAHTLLQERLGRAPTVEEVVAGAATLSAAA